MRGIFKRVHRIVLWCVLTMPVVVAAGCSHAEYQQASGIVWNTTYNITYCADKEMVDSVLSTLEGVELSVSAFNPNSIVSRINSNKSFETDYDFEIVYNTAVEINRLTDKAFDPTLAPLINLYGFGYEQMPAADTLRINEILEYVGIEHTVLRKGKLVKDDARTQFNFSALAKGYGCDAVADMFRRNGLFDYMVEIGGEISLSGKNPQNTPWRISIDRPIFSNDSVIHDSQMVIELTDCGLATSGNYRNFKILDGRRVVHTISRFSGLPVNGDILSASIIVFSPNSGKKDVLTHTSPCMYADALATATMSMDSKKAMRLIEAKKIAALLILADGIIYESPAFKQHIKVM